MKCERLLAVMSRYGFVIIFACISVVIAIIIIGNHTVQQKRINELETAIQEQLKTQTEILFERISRFESLIVEQTARQTELLLEAGRIIGSSAAVAVIEQITAGTNVTGRQITTTNESIQRINAVYAGLLAEMEKRTLESLYSEVLLVDMEKDADALFAEGRYAQAGALYGAVAEARPENTDARFYFFYSMFLNNKMDRSNYPRIKEGLQSLERNGYHRMEIRDVLEFIELEERGLDTRVLH